jgi:hypothetical protein
VSARVDLLHQRHVWFQSIPSPINFASVSPSSIP